MSDLSNALVNYLEFGSATWPQSNEQAFAALSPEDQDKAKEILAFAGDCQPDFEDLAVGAKLVREAVHDRYPFLSDDALDATAWAWSYWSR